ncbi:hypothetical protein E4K39_06590 [Neisseria meningitidis]|uniref:Uncharacterized protein n=1 Tax=Neisseria meningitidis TaxID=487 RepID=A0AAC9CUF9_NEIME|nr:hypothetical protein [Neisseria meningitidis]ANW91921.1 hypothetical protein DE8555_1377 [Neisseria meningitidis]EJU66834.1 hypothetical protein NMEN98008_1350 [Neisseria meningitidis 98008]EJU78386.1 hypothetical protein NMEN3081_1575 [Neisseria meningitidis NM3081]MBG8585669.1 hypothetical protein [Neisseria meningitidis]MBG8587331.1 hypothetical protein [Neisseria meningitidis]
MSQKITPEECLELQRPLAEAYKKYRTHALVLYALIDKFPQLHGDIRQLTEHISARTQDESEKAYLQGLLQKPDSNPLPTHHPE